MRSLLINIGLACASVVSFFLLAEFGLRITGLQTTTPNPPAIYQTSNNPAISYELIPNIQEKAYRQVVTTNQLGFRSPELTTQPLIAVLGDSITFGYGVQDDETLPAQLDALLPSYQVLNAGVPAYQLAQETATYTEKIAPLDPSALVLVFFFNDFTTETAWLDDQGIVRAEDWVPGTNTCDPINRGLLKLLPGKCWLDMHSAFYRAFKKLVNMRYNNELLTTQREASQAEPEEDNVTQEQLATYAEQLSVLSRQLPRNLPRVFVIWPDRYLHTTSRPILRTMAEEQGFTVVDLYDTFGNQAETLGWDTVHPSAATIQAAATVIAPVLQNKLP